jgi:metal-responsive CopG/Arc/MetJ family transcriptional regulator
MNTALSLPDRLVEEAEAIAASLGVSLSDFYTDALVAYCKKYSDRHYNDQQQQDDLNQFYVQESSQLDPVIAQMQFASIPHEEW